MPCRGPFSGRVAVALAAMLAVMLACASEGASQVLVVQLENQDFARVVPTGHAENQMVGSDLVFTNTRSPQDRLFGGFSGDDGGGGDDEGGGAEDDGPLGRQALGLGVGVSVEVSGNNQFINIPVVYYPFAAGGRWVRGLSLTATVPVVHRTTRITYNNPDPSAASPVETREGDTWGLGDVAIGIGYQVRWRNVVILPTVTVKFPTGDENARDGGVHTPLGSGSYDVTAGLSVGFQFRDWRQVNSVAYRYNGPAEFNLGPDEPPTPVEQGAHLMASTGVETDFFIDDLWVGVGFSFFYAGTSTWDDVDANTDVYSLQANAPYAYYQITSNLRVEAGLTIPIWVQYDDRLTTKPEFTDNLRGNVGIRFLF